mgnify:CR=1 FL=1
MQIEDKIDGRIVMNPNIRCNACEKQIKMENGILKEDVFAGYKEWGYFSKKDLKVDRFYLCEECYEKIIKSFAIPIERIEKVEVL